MKKAALLLMVLVMAGCSAVRKQQAGPRTDTVVVAAAEAYIPIAEKSSAMPVETIEGVAYDYMGPVVDARVRMSDKDGNVMECYCVDTMGRFSIPLHADTRIISFSAPGYITRDIRTEELKQPGERGTIRLDVEMASEKSS